MAKPSLVVLVGPTASGKTALSLRLAQHIPLTIVSADSRQVYRGLDIGTAKPTREELDQVPHRCIDILGPSDPYSAGQYADDALRAVSEVFGDGRMPLVVGGSGLYLRALLEGLTPLPGRDEDLRRVLEERLAEEGERGLLAELTRVDPEAARSIESGKPRRVIRALEIYYLTGRPLSEHHAAAAADRPFASLKIGLNVPRGELRSRIDGRAAGMVEAGLIREVEAVLDAGTPRTAQSLNTVGYKEVLQHLEGRLSVEEMLRSIQQSTRQFAKRQMTWFRAEKDIHWVDASSHRSPEVIEQDVLALMRVHAGVGPTP